MNTTLTRPIFLASREADLATTLLDTAEVGDIITWEALSKSFNKDARKHRGAIVTARKRLLNEKQKVFAAVKGVGYKRLDHGEVVAAESTTPRKIGRITKRSMSKLATVAMDKIDEATKRTYTVASATLGALALCVATRSKNALEQRVISNGSTAPAETLLLFAK